ncbi:hypothetical protein CCMA1212_006002 [Trichoderma ghanense]|uniref:Uncharacterized protein n=1 Tax=Trichoderma ghanense TaxID=65468 RepID=A0ABY2H3G0_9HYPO
MQLSSKFSHTKQQFGDWPKLRCDGKLSKPAIRAGESHDACIDVDKTPSVTLTVPSWHVYQV